MKESKTLLQIWNIDQTWPIIWNSFYWEFAENLWSIWNFLRRKT